MDAAVQENNRAVILYSPGSLMLKGQPMIALDVAAVTTEGNSWPYKTDSNAPFTDVSSFPPEIWLGVYFEIQNTHVNCLGIFL